MRLKLLNIRFLLFLLTILIFGSLAHAQRSIDTFGKNRVQYEVFKWKYLTSKHFNIYYYQNGERLAHNAARHLESQYERITDMLGMIPNDRIELIVYNSVQDLQQSNIGLRNQDFIGGETNLVKARIEVAFKGSHVVFKNDLVEGVCKKLMEMLLFGGRLKETVQASYMLHLPDWFIPGAAAYLGHGETPDMYASVYDAIKNNDADPSKLNGAQARILGQSYWAFLSDKYGPYTIANVLGLTRIVHNEEAAFSSALGLNYGRMVREWDKYYRNKFYTEIDQAYPDELGLVDPDSKGRVRRRNRKEYHYANFRFSPDGQYLAYSEAINGKIRIIVKDLQKGSKKVFFSGGHRIVDQVVNQRLPAMAWRDRNTLSIIRHKNGKPFMLTKGVKGGGKERKSFKTFEEILDIDYSTIGNYMVISGTKKGHSDIFIYDYKRDRARQVTNDLYDDLHPRFVPNSYDIVFSSNRTSDTLKSSFGESQLIKDNYDIFSFSSQEVEVVTFKRITKSEQSVTMALPLPSGDYLLKIRNNHQYHIGIVGDSSMYIDQVSKFAQSTIDFHYNPFTSSVAFTQQDRFREFLYIQSPFDFSKTYNQFPRIEDDELKLVKQDTSSLLDALSEINLDLIQFESDTADKTLDSSGKIITKNEEKDRQTIYGPYKYQGLYSVDYVVTNLLLDPLRGGGILMQGGTGEMFFNHKLNLSLHLQIDLRNSNFYVEYEYLKRRIDFKIRYKNENIFRTDDSNGEAFTYNANIVETEISLPWNQNFRTSITPISNVTRFTQFDFNPNNEDEYNYFGGLRFEAVLDNTKEKMLNLREGTRFKASFTPYVCVNDESKNFAKLNIDYRKYTKLVKHLYLASRVGYGAFMGDANRSFLLGGADNWLFPHTDNTGPGSPLQIAKLEDNTRMLFLEYATNVRGFNYNRMFGRQYTIFNLELRFPIAKALHRGPIASNFFRNLILTGFYDAGSAWDTGNPFKRDNNINTRDDYAEAGSPYDGTIINNYINPFIQSYGFGMRSTLMGYYMKLDLAWPRVNYNTEKPKLFLTLGYDF